VLALATWFGAGALSAQQNDSLDSLLDQPAAPAQPSQAPSTPSEGSELDDLQGGGGGGLDDLQGGSLEGLESRPSSPPAAPSAPAASASRAEDPRALRLTVNGYVKPVAVWETRDVPEEFASAGAEDLNRFTTVGARTQIRAQGVIKDVAQFFTAVNFDFNEVNRDDDTISTSSEKGELRMVESYIDLFGEGTRWRIGSQLVTWGFMDGFEVPADRFNARDTGYKSVELEDLKLAETGVEFSWSFGKQRMDWFYVPISKVNRLPPDFERAFIDSPVTDDDENTTPPVSGTEVVSNHGKYAVHFSGTFSPVDYQLNYMDALDTRPNLKSVTYPEQDFGPPYAKEYRRTRSPGLDLQFDLGSALLRMSSVYFDTGDPGNKDPLIQNDWYQIMAGAEFWVGSALMQLNVGRKEVVDWEELPFIDSVFLGQPAKSTNIVAGSFNDTFLTGAALELNFLLAYLWNAENGKLVAFRVRPYFAYNVADGVAITLMPSFGNEVGIQTYEIYSEVKFSF